MAVLCVFYDKVSVDSMELAEKLRAMSTTPKQYEAERRQSKIRVRQLASEYALHKRQKVVAVAAEAPIDLQEDSDGN